MSGVEDIRPRPSPNSYWVVEGRLAAGEYPVSGGPAESARRLGGLLDGGIDHFIDLTEERDGLEPYADIVAVLARRPGPDVTWERHPIRDHGVPRTASGMTAILDAIDSALGAGRNVYVHCWGGVGRTGTVVGCWLVRHGSPGDAALRRVDGWWRTMDKAVPWWDSPETGAQKRFVREWSEAGPG